MWPIVRTRLPPFWLSGAFTVFWDYVARLNSNGRIMDYLLAVFFL